MRYSVLGFNQEKVMQTNLDLTDLVILQYIEQACGSPRMKHILTDEEQTLVWINHAKFHEDLPILDMSESTLKNRLSKLKKDGFIQSQTITNPNIKGTCTYYGITELTVNLLYSSDDVIENETTYCEKYVVSQPRTVKSTSYNKLNIDSKLEGVLDNKLSNTTADGRNCSSSKKSLLSNVITERPKRNKKPNLYEKCIDYIMQYTNNVVLQEKLKTYLTLRLEIAKSDSKPFYYNMWPPIINELDELAKDTNTAVKIVEQSIRCGWRKFFPLREYNNKSNMKVNPSETSVTTDKKSDTELDLIDEEY